MKHFASSEFWDLYGKLPADVRKLADKKFALLKRDPQHPSLHFKKVGRYWSVRIGIHYRALATQAGDDLRWHWIGSHSEYDVLTR
jgi:steroid 5-alpha reductase family enzyme